MEPHAAAAARALIDSLIDSLIDAWLDGDEQALSGAIAADCALRIWHRHGRSALRPRDRVVARLRRERDTWLPGSLELLERVVAGDRLALQLRAACRTGERRAEVAYAMFATVRDGAIYQLDVYVTGPTPVARRREPPAPASLSDAELDRELAALACVTDLRHNLPTLLDHESSLQLERTGSGGADPTLNQIHSAHFADADADARISATIEHYRGCGAGFVWAVSPLDRPRDLGQRLERAGCVLAGRHAVMVRRDLDPTSIPSSPELEIRPFDTDSPAELDAAIAVMAEAFGWNQEQRSHVGGYIKSRSASASYRASAVEYIAWQGGSPVGYAGLRLRGGFAVLEGAATLPAHQGRGVYRTLLRRRLAEARARGYHLATITALPASRRIVERFEFELRYELATYAWRPAEPG